MPAYGRCALGWAVLDRRNFSHVLARAAEPLLFGNTALDSGSYDSGPSVYTDGVMSEGPTADGDSFVVFAGGADSVVEAVRIKVSIKSDDSTGAVASLGLGTSLLLSPTKV